MTSLLHAISETFHSTVLGNYIPITITIENTYKTSIDFTLYGNPYTFAITAWQSRGIRKYLEKFHDVTAPRDISTYGIMIEKLDGSRDFLEDLTDLTKNPDGTYSVGTNSKPMTHYQKLNAIKQGAKDIMTCLNLIGEIHRRSILEYCVWYREMNHPDQNYSYFITLTTCHSVVHSDFMAPNIQWQLVEFPQP